jgi:ligand-binding SRPBCC domain-containing protein
VRFRHTFLVRAPLVAVADFHQQSASMGAITPPPVIVNVHQAPARLGEGDEMNFTLWLGPLPLRWQARIQDVTPASFTDRQVRGPFRRWTHYHLFVPVDEAATMVVDQIQAMPRCHPLWGPVGLGMWLSLPILFAYRGWKTRRLLEDRT